MKYSTLLGKTRKNIPSEATAINHKLLLQAGFVDQLAAGVFTWLPLGLRVLRKIDAVIREEMNAIGGQEVTMPALIAKSNWEKGERWEGVDILFKTKSQTDKEYGLGFSHEEVVTPLAGQYIQSYKDLPLSIYQIQTKFRDELRAKSGLLRGREFGMKDLYSFHATEEDLLAYYELVKKAYIRVFARCGLKDVKITEASGGSFTKKHSHEFNVLTPAGEVDLWYCEACTFAQNSEVANLTAGSVCPSCNKGKIVEGKAIEIGNIFDLGTTFADRFGLSYADKEGKKQKVIMGCYGIGDTRLVGTLVELFHDERGIVWPSGVAPYAAHLISLPGGEKVAQKLYEELTAKGIDVLWDERDVAAGVKFADADLIGIPVRLVVSEKTGEKVEIKKRTESASQMVVSSVLLEQLKKA
jgi:prolyl-tRNA synthetase